MLSVSLTWGSCGTARIHVWSAAVRDTLEESPAPPPCPGGAGAAYSAEIYRQIPWAWRQHWNIQTNTVSSSSNSSSSSSRSTSSTSSTITVIIILLIIVVVVVFASVPVAELSGRWWRPGRCPVQTRSVTRCASPDKHSTLFLSGYRTQTGWTQTRTCTHSTQGYSSTLMVCVVTRFRCVCVCSYLSE